MERSRAAKPLVTCTKLLAIAAFTLPVWLPSAQAQEQDFLCDATQASTNELPVLEKSCPIGKGLWGNQKPKHNQSTFWIQCGLLNKPLSLAEAKALYNVVSGDVWNKPEDKGTRCLIGPYQDYKQARADMLNVRKVKSYEEAFIREVASKSAGMAKPAPAPRQKNKSKAVEPKQVATSAVPVATTMSTADTEMPSEVTVRLTAEVSGVTYKVPYLMFSDEQFYMEHGLPWNRLNYKTATELCAEMDMMLPTEAQWQQLLDANIMSKNKWPMHLPYWGKDRKALFTTGKVSQLKGTSLLNVACIK